MPLQQLQLQTASRRSPVAPGFIYGFAISAVQAIVESPSPNVKTAFQLMSWRESHLLLPASLTLSTLAGKAFCDLSNFLSFYLRLRWLCVLEEENREATLTTNHKQKVANNTWIYIQGEPKVSEQLIQLSRDHVYLQLYVLKQLH